MPKNITAVLASIVAAAAILTAAPAYADVDDTTEPSMSEATATETTDPTGTETSEPTETAEPTDTETAEPTKTETSEKPAAPATVTVTKTETPAPTTTVRPSKDEPVADPCEWTTKYRPTWCVPLRPTVTTAPR